MNTFYIPDKDLSIDESMMLWRGRLVFRQYIENKRHKYGTKLYELCESDGVVMKVRVYSGESVVDSNSLGQTGAVVLDLMEQFLDQGYCLYTDNYYNSFELSKHLVKKKTYNCGTLRSDCKSNHQEVTKSKLKKEEVISRSREGIIVSKWKDKCDVLMISNTHELKMVEVANKRGEKKMKPNMVRNYKNGMSGVDRSDQMVSYYDCLRKTTQWYKKLALHIFDILVFNAFCLNSKYGTVKLPQLLKFREIITTHTLLQYLPQKRKSCLPNHAKIARKLNAKKHAVNVLPVILSLHYVLVNVLNCIMIDFSFYSLYKGKYMKVNIFKIKLFAPGFRGQSQEFSFKYQKSSENKRNDVIRKHLKKVGTTTSSWQVSDARLLRVYL